MNRGRRLVARLGLDGNSPRRRTDKIAAYGELGPLAMFLVGAPVLTVCAEEAGNDHRPVTRTDGSTCHPSVMPSGLTGQGQRPFRRQCHGEKLPGIGE